METIDMSALNAEGQLVDSNGQKVLENRLNSELVWRTCIIVKAGTSRLLIACLIILFVMLATWIWASSPAGTEKGHQVLGLFCCCFGIVIIVSANLDKTFTLHCSAANKGNNAIILCCWTCRSAASVPMGVLL